MSSDSTFEEPLVELRRQIQELENYPSRPGIDKDVDRLRARLRKETEEVYKGLNRWQKTLSQIGNGRQFFRRKWGIYRWRCHKQSGGKGYRRQPTNGCELPCCHLSSPVHIPRTQALRRLLRKNLGFTMS